MNFSQGFPIVGGILHSRWTSPFGPGGGVPVGHIGLAHLWTPPPGNGPTLVYIGREHSSLSQLSLWHRTGKTSLLQGYQKINSIH